MDVPVPKYYLIINILRQTFAKAAQLDFARQVAERLGYDLRRGRLDLTLHPFSTRFSADDVRITTRVSEVDFATAFGVKAEGVSVTRV